MFTLRVNGKTVEVDVAPDTPLLWVLRDHLGLTGTKYGCGLGQCGACSVHLNGRVQRSCVFPVVAVGTAEITTIEGLVDHPVQQAWIAEQVPQCGYCQTGQVMAAVALLDHNPEPSDSDIDATMTNLCRCGTYGRIRRGIHRAAKAMQDTATEAPDEESQEASG